MIRQGLGVSRLNRQGPEPWGALGTLSLADIGLAYASVSLEDNRLGEVRG